MSTSDRCPTKLIDDAPSTTDAFAPEGQVGAHERVADTLLDIIETEAGGRAVGLEGRWGSGKSTVISLLEEKLSRDKKTLVTVFDAWAHEGDPLRRTFLESVVHTILRRRENWIASKEWDDKLKELSNRLERTTQTTIPEATRLGKVVGLLALLVPFGSAVLAYAFDEGPFVDYLIPFSWTVLVGAFFTLAPAIILLGVALIIGFRKASGKKPARWDLLLSETATKVETESIRSANPTSVEFEKYFTDLMEEALDGHDRKLILVLDNLDRVDAELALEIWSTLQTFLKSRDIQETSWFSNLWVIVPYDPDGIRKLWENDSGSGATSDKSQSFLDKSFQVRLRVPPTLLSDWKGYLFGLLEDALPGHGEEERHTLYRVYKSCKEPGSAPPTPRELVLFVNQLGTLHRQWGHDIPLPHLALYAIKSREHTSIAHLLLNGELSDRVLGDLYGKGASASLAGLEFNVPPRRGLELLLKHPIEVALAGPNPEELGSLAQTHGDGFWAVLEGVLNLTPGNDECERLAKIGTALFDSGVWSQESRLELNGIRQRLRSCLLVSQGWTRIDPMVHRGAMALIEMCHDTEVTKHLVATMAERHKDPQSLPDGHAALRLDHLSSLFEKLDELGHSDILEDYIFYLPLNPSGWITFGQYLQDSGTNARVLGSIHPDFEFDELAEQLGKDIDGGSLTEDHVACIELSNRSAMDTNWGVAVSNTGQFLGEVILERADSPATSDTEAALLARMLIALRSTGALTHTESAELLVGDAALGVLDRHMASQATSALWLYLYLGSKPDWELATDAKKVKELASVKKKLEEGNLDLARSLASVVSSYRDSSFYWNVIDTRGQCDPLIRQCCQITAEGDSRNLIFTPDIVVKNWPLLRSELRHEEFPEAYDSMLGWLKAESAIYEALEDLQDPLSKEVIDFCEQLQQAEPQNELFNEWCANRLAKLGKERWYEEFLSGGSGVRLLLSLLEAGIAVDGDTGYMDALVSHAGDCVEADENDISTLPRSYWSFICDVVDGSSLQKELKRRLLRCAIDADGEVSAVFFAYYGPEILDPALLLENDKVLSHFFTPLVRNTNQKGLEFIEEVLRREPEFLDKVEDVDSKRAFLKRVEDTAYKLDAEGDAKPTLVVVAELLGITIEQQPEEEAAAEADGDTKADSR